MTATPDSENDDQRNAAAVRTSERGTNEARAKRQRQDERNARANDREPADFAALVTGEEFAGLGAGEKHQQQQTQPIDKGQNAGLMFAGLHQSCNDGQAPEQGRTEHYTGTDFADDFGLAQPDEQVAQHLCQAYEK